MQLYFVERVEGNTGFLSKEEGRHLRDVVRMRIGDPIHCTDGLGNEYWGKIAVLDKKGGEIEIDRHSAHTPAAQIHLAIAPTKNTSRLELALEKATEIGVQVITPILCQHSERKHIRAERLNKIIRSAAKQSQKMLFPNLEEQMKFADFIKKHAGKENCYLAYCGEEKLPLLNRIYAPANFVVLMIGPEGDFSPAEAALAVKAGFQLVSLGESRLRTETAAIVGASILQQKNYLDET